MHTHIQTHTSIDVNTDRYVNTHTQAHTELLKHANLRIFVQGYVPLYIGFESFYTRNVYRRIQDCWNRTICSVPGAIIDLMERTTPDYGWTMK